MITLLATVPALLLGFLNLKRAILLLAALAAIPVVLGDIALSSSTEILALPGMITGWYVDQLLAVLDAAAAWLSSVIADALKEVNPL